MTRVTPILWIMLVGCSGCSESPDFANQSVPREVDELQRALNATRYELAQALSENDDLRTQLKRLEGARHSLEFDQKLSDVALSHGLKVGVHAEGAEVNIKSISDMEDTPYRVIRLEANRNPLVDDSFLGHLAGTTGLHWIGLRYGNIRGPGLSHLESNSHLDVMYLEGNPIDDAGLSCLPRLASLRQLNVSESLISDACVSSLEAFAELDDLHVDCTSVTNNFVEKIAKILNLKKLGLRRTRITDACGPHLREMRRLVTLNLAETAVTDAIIPQVVSGTLQELILDGTAITDAALAGLVTAKKLEVLGVRNTRVSDEAVQRLKEALPGLNLITR